MVAYLGWEWTQIGFTRDTHYGHKNVILRDLDDGMIPTRPIHAGGLAGQGMRTRQIAEALDLEAAERLPYLEKACAGDVELLAEVAELLRLADDGTFVYSKEHDQLRVIGAGDWAHADGSKDDPLQIELAYSRMETLLGPRFIAVDTLLAEWSYREYGV